MCSITRLLTLVALLLTGSAAKKFRDQQQAGDGEEISHPQLKDDQFKPSLNIFYGDDAEKAQFPFMVRLTLAIKWSADGSGTIWGGRCGGAILDKNHIITAAHCVVNQGEDDSDYWMYPMQPQNFYVWVGDHSANSVDGDESLHHVEAVLVHQDYDDWEISNDIAVLVLSENIDFSTGLAEAITMPVTSDSSLRDEGSPVTVAGWGMDETGGLADILQYLEYEFASTSDCNTYYPGWVEDGMVCTADLPLPSDKRTWSGDSGSPLFVERDDGNNTIMGLVSWGTGDSSATDSYDVNTDVWYYRDWVNEMMGSNNDRVRSERVDSDISRDVDVVRFMNTWHYFYTDDLKYVKATISLDDFGSNDIVMVYEAPSGSIYDGGYLLGGLTGDDAGTFYSTVGSGLIIMVVSDDGTSHGSFSYEITTVIASPGNDVTSCGDGFWACTDYTYCIYDYLKCDGDPEWAECQDASDESTDICGEGSGWNMTYYLLNPNSMYDEPSEGIIVAMNDNGSYYGCDDDMGGYVAQTACRHFGYTTGELVSPWDYLQDDRNRYEITFGSTAVSCPADSYDLNDCEGASYEMSDVACFDGEQLAVRCTNEPWTFTINEFSTTTMTRNRGSSLRGRGWCGVVAQKYGADIDQKDNLWAVLYNMKEDGETLETIDDDGEYKKSKEKFKFKIRKDLESGESKNDQCFICVIYASSYTKYTYEVDANCGVSWSDSTVHRLIRNAQFTK